MATISVILWGLFIAYRVHVYRRDVRQQRELNDRIVRAMKKAHRLEMEMWEGRLGVTHTAQIIPFPPR